MCWRRRPLRRASAPTEAVPVPQVDGDVSTLHGTLLKPSNLAESSFLPAHAGRATHRVCGRKALACFHMEVSRLVAGYQGGSAKLL